MLSSLGGPDFLARLDAWAAEAAAEETVARRRRERWLLTQAGEEATFAGVLVDLAERARPVVVTTRAGTRHRGALRLVGRDVVLVETDAGTAVFVALAAVAAVRQPPGEAPVLGDRALRLDVTMVEVLQLLAADRPRLSITSGGSTVAGELRRVGVDVVALRLDGEAGAVYAPTATLEEVVVDHAAAAQGL